MSRPLYEIAHDIRCHYPKVHYSAEPYLEAMSELTYITDSYYQDDARGIVLRFLGNARTWKGDDARRIKAELKAILK